MRTEYKKSAVYNDVVVPNVARLDDKYVIQLSDQDGNVYAIVEFETQ